ncbi:MAG TPA: hypothetical protein VIL09_00180 [Microvirga sp.]
MRTGLQDNIRVIGDRLPTSDAEFLALAVEAVQRHGRPVDRAVDARAILGFRKPD